MVTLQTADNALKSFYLDAVAEALNTKVNPLLAKIQQTSANVVGKDVRKTIRLGINGGIGAGSETGNLPSASSQEYAQFVATLKNLYGTIEISDKAIRASANNEGAFVNLLNEEMDSLIKSASFNFGRMLFGDGMGGIANVLSVSGTNIVYVDNVGGLVEGMIVDFYDPNAKEYSRVLGRKIISVNRDEKYIKVDGEYFQEDAVDLGHIVTLHSSAEYEITGLGALFSDKAIYGVDRDASFMKPYIKEDVGTISESAIQKAMDSIEEVSGSKVNFIVCSWGVRRALMEYFKSFNVVLPTLQFEGGFTAMSYNGIPIVVDRFCPAGCMYLLNTDDFKLHQLCDWQWLEGEDGKILKQVPGKPVYTATLVKYAELMCERPHGQGLLKGITEA